MSTPIQGVWSGLSNNEESMMFRNMLPYLLVFGAVCYLAFEWWRTTIPTLPFFSLKTNRRLLKVGFIVGVTGLLLTPFGHPPEVALVWGVLVVFALWLTDLLLRA